MLHTLHHLIKAAGIVACELYSQKVDKLINIYLDSRTNICAIHMHTYYMHVNTLNTSWHALT